MTFEDATFSVIFDKGMLDAFFSNTEDSCADNNNVRKYLAEGFRVLQPLGRFLIISTNNDTDLVLPYVYEEDWEVDHFALEVDNAGRYCTGGRAKGCKTLYTMYVLTKSETP
mmetsp:Transcript_36889/g.65889  ORF Transcript_36889/g.65889 Transcript_36889/m.65889 type:complete len:112 (-) Transcript_36889:257-592(-)